MTDIITHAPFANRATRSVRIPRLSLPLLAIIPSFKSIETMVGLFALAYVAPFSVSMQNQQSAPDPELEGRDPRW